MHTSIQATAQESLLLDSHCADHSSDVGKGLYRVCFTYTGENWTHADVAAIGFNTHKPIAVLPVQYTQNAAQPGAEVAGKNIGLKWNKITQEELAKRLRTAGFFVLTPTIQMYGENWDGFQGLEHFIAGVHKGNENVQTILLTADSHIVVEQNPFPGAQMLVTGIHDRNLEWEATIQRNIAPFYKATGLRNIGARVRGGLSDTEGSSKAWHPLIERAAEFGPTVTIMEAAQAVQIVEQAGSIEAGRQWGGPLFDGIVAGMVEYNDQLNKPTPACE
jgi:hypothetical protein